MAIKLLSEVGAAWAAVVITACGGAITTAIHYGKTQQQIASLQAQVDRHDAALAAIQEQSATNAQALADIKDTVHDIQQQVHHDNHR